MRDRLRSWMGWRFGGVARGNPWRSRRGALRSGRLPGLPSCWLAALWLFFSVPAGAQLSPPATGGAVELDRLLQRIAEPHRLLVMAAHPDDEDTELLAFASLGYGAEAAYLSLSRGEGGQNLIGDELGELLGLIRSRELLAARATDGAQQFFTRAFDFGFSKTLEEALRFWPVDSVLKDAVRVVRLFRPHVMVSVFSGTPRDGHGQHQEAGVIARRAFEAAGDPTAFPELEREEGLRPWRPLRLYQSTRFDTTRTTITLQTGRLEARSGRSYHQIAMASRSLHRSQDMGQIQHIGPSETRLGLIAARDGADTGRAARGAELFAGLPSETTWLTRLADSLRARLSAVAMTATAQPLAAAVARAARDPGVTDSVTGHQLQRALAVAAGLVLDARADREELVDGDRAQVVVELFNSGPFPVTLDSAVLTAPAGWTVAAVAAPAQVGAGTMTAGRFTVTVSPDAQPTQPYFLERPRSGAMYDWSSAPAVVRGRPFDPPPLAVRAFVSLLGAHIALTRDVTYRYDDQARGEVRRPVRVVPVVDVRLEPDVVVWPTDADPTRTFTVTLVSHAAAAISGGVRLVVAGWPEQARAPFALARAGESETVTLQLQRPAGVGATASVVRAVARLDDGSTFDRSAMLVEYPHIQPTPYVRLAAATLRLAPIGLPRVARVGYIRGASDRVPEALQQVGLPLVLLAPQDLASGDLSRFDAIVIGSRAYETDTALVHHNQRLLDYARNGGLVVTQYQQYPFINGNFAPFPLTIARPHDRVTDETAAVTMLEPEHPAFTTPNRIEGRDWDGWPQDRGLYFAHTWDAAYTPLLSMNDPGSEPLKGGLLVAPYGKGVYVYTGLAFFRALPAGVPGAYRLFLNLLALKGRTLSP